MKDILEIGLLLDFYGQMLTERQYEVLDLHYNDDLSMGEIAEHLHISRQGVFDNIKRGKAILFGLEAKLGLVKRFMLQKGEIGKILSHLEEIEKDCSVENEAVIKKLKNIKSITERIMNQF